MSNHPLVLVSEFVISLLSGLFYGSREPVGTWVPFTIFFNYQQLWIVILLEPAASALAFTSGHGGSHLNDEQAAGVLAFYCSSPVVFFQKQFSLLFFVESVAFIK
ncbi:unnamed protein product [Cuscuta europaea]|uniref:Uncharacterized protein n=1 Tax=Cuscuta europaea TaxID=41803 RepID=A0A9P1DYS4_CUSEU|nr:unnamed protein product [Cuscuta europaea]